MPPKIQKEATKLQLKKDKESLEEKFSDTSKAYHDTRKLAQYYKRDNTELSAYQQYLKAQWAYFYVYPEYFDAVAMPGISSSASYMITSPETIHVQANAKGMVLIHFCPGAVMKKKVKIPAVAVLEPRYENVPAYPAFSNLTPENTPGALSTMIERARAIDENQKRKANYDLAVKAAAETEREIDPMWFGASSNPDAHDAHYEIKKFGLPAQSDFLSARCIGGYLKIETGPNNTGMIKIQESVRTTEEPNAKDTMTKFKNIGQLLATDMTFRHRVIHYDDLLQTDTTEFLAYDILLYNLPVNSSVSLSIFRALQGEFKTKHKGINYLSAGTYKDFIEQKRVIKSLLSNFPLELKVTALDDPLHYHHFLFSKCLVKTTLFPIKNRTKPVVTPVNLNNVSNIDLKIVTDHAQINEHITNLGENQRKIFVHDAFEEEIPETKPEMAIQNMRDAIENIQEARNLMDVETSMNNDDNLSRTSFNANRSQKSNSRFSRQQKL